MTNDSTDSRPSSPHSPDSDQPNDAMPIDESEALPLSTRPASDKMPGRNEPCWCGSGRKYKKCCLAADEAAAKEAADRKAAEVRKMKPEPVSQESDEQEKWLPEIASEEEISPEVADRLVAIWKEFDAIKDPSVDQLDEFLTQLLDLPPDSVKWSEVIHLFGRLHHPDLAAPFRRIVATVPHKATDMHYFYWAATEEAYGRGLPDLLPEVSEGLQRIDPDNLEIEVLEYVIDYILAAGFDVAARNLAEHFLPALLESGELVPGTYETWPGFVFRLRVGDAIRAWKKMDQSPKAILDYIQQGIEAQLDSENTRRVAAFLNDPTAAPETTRASFDLVKPTTTKAAELRKENRRMNHALIGVAREAWEVEKRSPGASYWSLLLTLESVYQWKADSTGKSKKGGDNLLDFLRPSGLEARVTHSSRDFIGLKKARATLLLQGHEILTRFAVRHALITAVEAQSMEHQLEKLYGALKPR